MSVLSWVNEAFPKVEKFKSSKESYDKMTPKELVEAAIIKWQMLETSNLERHGLKKSGLNTIFHSEHDSARYIDGEDSMVINGANCSLCVAYNFMCHRCPIYKYNASRNPSFHVWDRTCSNEYTIWEESGDVKPMVDLLQKTSLFLDDIEQS